MGRLTENSVVNLKNKSYAFTAEIDVPESGAEGVIVAQGGVSGGLSLYAKDGKPKYCYNFFGLERSNVEGTAPSRRQTPGTPGVRLRRRWRRQGRHGDALYRWRQVGDGRIEQTEACSSPPTRPATSATSSARL